MFDDVLYEKSEMFAFFWHNPRVLLCRHFKNNLAILEIVKSKWLIVSLDKIILHSASVENAVLVS